VTDGDYGAFGVKPQAKHHPAESDDKVGLARIDGNRMFTSDLGNQAMGAKPRQFKGGGENINAARPGKFKVRRRTLSKG